MLKNPLLCHLASFYPSLAFVASVLSSWLLKGIQKLEALQRRSTSQVCFNKIPTNCQCNQYDRSIRLGLLGKQKDKTWNTLLYTIINGIVKNSHSYPSVKNGTLSVATIYAVNKFAHSTAELNQM